ncbi:cache domain-containing protein [Candidatus Halobeggiatoa sp. HSG11]|nr:cache domain-containing protein [Candidatus Halobeggiatoa sp. HSG11]
MNNFSHSETRLVFFRSLRGKLTLLFLIISLIPLITVGLLAYKHAQDALQIEIINKLTAVRDIKARQINNYFNERLADIKILSNNPTVITAMNDFDKAFQDADEAMEQFRSLYSDKPDMIDADDGSIYSNIHAQYHSMFQEYKNTYHYYDIFLVEPHLGIILYSVDKENDFATSLIDGPYANTNIAHVFKEMLQVDNNNTTILEDFAYYEPSEEAAAFVASPIFNHTELVGVLIFQLSIKHIDANMQESTGLGETGETLLVSSDDFLLRSNSRLVQKDTIFKQKIDNKEIHTGQTGIATIDYLGKSQLITYTPLKISGINWSLITKIDKTEAFASIQYMLILLFSIIFVGSILIGVIAFLFSQKLVKPIQKMTDIAHQLANGNLNLTVDTKNNNDEIGVMAQAFQHMIINLREIIDDISQISQGLATGDLSVIPKANYQGDFLQIKR